MISNGELKIVAKQRGAAVGERGWTGDTVSCSLRGMRNARPRPSLPLLRPKSNRYHIPGSLLSSPFQERIKDNSILLDASFVGKQASATISVFLMRKLRNLRLCLALPISCFSVFHLKHVLNIPLECHVLRGTQKPALFFG